MTAYGGKSPTAYYTSYSRALCSYVNNGFFSRDLDADDIAFIEHVRERGSVPCGSLGFLVPTQCTHSDDVLHRVVLEEEVEFWRLPYAVNQSIARRHGPVVRPPPQAPGSTPHAQSIKQNREDLKAAREAAEQAARDRQLEQLRRDVEWERAAPPPFGRVEDRHYVPQWKVDTERRSQIISRGREKLRARKISAKKRSESVRAAAAARRAQETAALQAQAAARETAALQAARRALDVLGQEGELLRSKIVSVMRSYYPQPTTIETLMRDLSLRPIDKAFLIDCLEVLFRTGQVRR